MMTRFSICLQVLQNWPSCNADLEPSRQCKHNIMSQALKCSKMLHLDINMLAKGDCGVRGFISDKAETAICCTEFMSLPEHVSEA